jgi:very-short-patch-repair endonuclease
MTLKLPEYLDRRAQIQRGILSASQARRSGVSAGSVRSYVQSGQWQQVYHGVYATFTGPLSRDALLWAVQWVEVPHGLPPGKRQVKAKAAGARVYRDVLYDEYALIVELDGRAAHPGDTRWKDIRRDNAAVVDGIMTLRFGWEDLRTRACFVADQVYRALRRSGPVSARPCSPLCPVGRDLLVHD